MNTTGAPETPAHSGAEHDGYHLEQDTYARTYDRVRTQRSPGGSGEVSRQFHHHDGARSVRLRP